MTAKSSYNSVGYHLHAISSILCGRTERVMYKYKLVIAAFFTGVAITLLAIAVPSMPDTAPEGISPSYPTPVDTTYVTTSNQTDTVETEITNVTDSSGNTIPWGSNQTNSYIHFEFTGQSLVQNVTVKGYECNIDSKDYIPCQNNVTLYEMPLGEHTFEVRAVDNMSNVDHTPAAFAWIVIDG